MNKSSFVTIETNKYGLSPMLSGETVQVRFPLTYVEFFHDHHPVSNYRRSYKINDDWTQYVSVLCQKPGAIEHTCFFHQIPQQWQSFLKKTSGRERKNALQLLSEIVSDGNTSLCDDALELTGERMAAQMRQVKLDGMAKEWCSAQFENPEQYVTDLLKLELKERETNRINRMVKTTGFRVLKTLDDFVWSFAIELPSGLTVEYMENFQFLAPKVKFHFHGYGWNR